MPNNSTFIIIVRFVLLVLVQTLIFNDLRFFGFINPMVYILFVYWHPIQNNRTMFLIASFLLGLTVDIFSDSLALHTVSVLTVAYLRPFLMRFCFGTNFDFQGFNLKNTTRIQRYSLLALIVIIHHFIYFSLEIFSFAHLLLILKKFFFISLGTLILVLLINSLFSREGSY